MNNQQKLFLYFPNHGIYLFCVCLTVLLFLVACSDKTTPSQFNYKLTQQAFQSELISPLTLQVQKNNIEFAIIFKGGGGSYDKARLERSKDTARVILFDADGKAQKMFVIYQLSGSISGFEPGKYTFQIENADGKLIAEDVFTIQ